MMSWFAFSRAHLRKTISFLTEDLRLFLSEEMSEVFPEDGCVVRTIALDITEAQQREIQCLRRPPFRRSLYSRLLANSASCERSPLVRFTWA